MSSAQGSADCLDSKINRKVAESVRRAVKGVLERFDRQVNRKVELLVGEEVEKKVSEMVADKLQAIISKQLNLLISKEELLAERRRSFISSKSHTPSYTQFNGVRRPSSQRKKKGSLRNGHNNHQNVMMSRKSALLTSQMSSPLS